MKDWLVVGENKELPALQHQAEVTNGDMDGPQLPVDCAVAGLGRCQFFGEEGEQGPGQVAEVLPGAKPRPTISGNMDRIS